MHVVFPYLRTVTFVPKLLYFPPLNAPFVLCRRRLRRQSARFISQTENLFEIEDGKLPVSCKPDSPMHSSGPTPLISSTRKEGEEDNCAPRRSSVGRPLRKAAEKVKSYKEVPIIVKMRRSE